MTLLTVIVPLTRMSGELGNLTSWLEDAREVESEIQVIIVHDIQDKTTGPEIKEITKNMKYVQIIENYFGSPGIARNNGKRHAKGKWVTFWDSDDIGNIVKLVDILKIEGNQSIEIIIFSYSVFTVKQNELTTIICSTDRQIAIDNLIQNPGIWRFCFRIETIREIEFSDSRMGEDQYFLALSDFENKRLLFSREIIYTYFRGRKGQATSLRSNIIGLKTILNSLENSIRNNPNVTRFFVGIYVRQSLTAIKRGSIVFRISSLFSLLHTFYSVNHSKRLWMIRTFIRSVFVS